MSKLERVQVIQEGFDKEVLDQDEAEKLRESELPLSIIKNGIQQRYERLICNNCYEPRKK